MNCISEFFFVSFLFVGFMCLRCLDYHGFGLTATDSGDSFFTLKLLFLIQSRNEMKWNACVYGCFIYFIGWHNKLWVPEEAKQIINRFCVRRSVPHWKFHNFKFSIRIMCHIQRAHCTTQQCGVVSHLLCNGKWQNVEIIIIKNNGSNKTLLLYKASTQNWQQMKLIMHAAISIESMWWKFAMHEMENGCVCVCVLRVATTVAAPSLGCSTCVLYSGKKKHATQTHSHTRSHKDCCVN